MKFRRSGFLLSITALVAACGGGGGGGSGGSSGAPPTGSNNPPPGQTAQNCTLRSRQDWVASELREWYLFPETLPASIDPGAYSNLQAFVDAMTATARSQRRDRYFTYVTSIAEENAFYQSGASAGLGVRLAVDSASRRLFITEAFEGAPGLAAGLDRGTEILAIGTSASNLRTVDSILASEGGQGLTNALGPDTVGTTRLLQVRDAGGTRNVTVAKAEYEIPPVSSRYGAKIIDDGGRKVGYLNLRTFISSADDPLRDAFAAFRQAGVTEVIVDFRYNGGGLVSIAQLMGDLMGGNRFASDVFSRTTFRPEKSENDETRLFRPQAESVSPIRLAFIGTGGSASASEMVINAFIPYLRANAALVGTNTYGKPVGQIARDRPECDDRLRVIAFAVRNADGQGDYFDGLAPKMNATCRASDDISRPLGDPQEASTRAALDFLAGRSCTPIGGGISAQAVGGRELLTPERPDTVQREVPGLF